MRASSTVTLLLSASVASCAAFSGLLGSTTEDTPATQETQDGAAVEGSDNADQSATSDPMDARAPMAGDAGWDGDAALDAGDSGPPEGKFCPGIPLPDTIFCADFDESVDVSSGWATSVLSSGASSLATGNAHVSPDFGAHVVVAGQLDPNATTVNITSAAYGATPVTVQVKVLMPNVSALTSTIVIFQVLPSSGATLDVTLNSTGLGCMGATLGFAPGGWHRVVFTLSGTSASCYIDSPGVTATASIPAFAKFQVALGATAPPQQQEIDVDMDDVLITSP